MQAGAVNIKLMADIADLQAKMQQAERMVTRAVGNINSQFSTLTGGIATGVGISGITKLVDEYAKYTAQLKLASITNAEYVASLNSVRSIAAASHADLAATGVLYARIANGTRELGIGQQQVARITESVNLSLKVSGATTAESASAMLQLSQAFASGTLRGEEFNAVNEAAPRLMKALAEGMGVPVGALKEMASNGLITSSVMASVLPRALADLREEAKSVQTISGAFVLLKNNALEFVGTQAQASGTVGVINDAIMMLADNLGVLAGAIITVMTVKLAGWLEGAIIQTYRSVSANAALTASNLSVAQSNVEAAAAEELLATTRVAELRASVMATEGAVALAIATNGLVPAQARAAAASEAHAASLAALSVAQRAASVTGTAVTGVLGLLGGPIGAIITLLGVGVTAWMAWGGAAKSGSEQAEKSALDSAKAITEGLNAQIKKIDERNAALSYKPSIQNNEQAEAIGKLQQKINQLDSLKTGSQQEEASRLVELNKLLAARGQIEVKVAEFDKKTEEEKNRRLKATAGAAAQEILQKQSGIPKSYLTDLKTLKDALDTGAISQDIYVKAVSKLASETWKASEAGKEAAKSSKAASKDARSAENDAKSQAKSYFDLIAAIKEKISINNQEASYGKKITEAEKQALDIKKLVEKGTISAAAASSERTKKILQEYAASEKLRLASEAYVEAEKSIREAGDSDLKSITDQIDKQREHNAEIGKTKEQIELARLEKVDAATASLQIEDDAIRALLTQADLVGVLTDKDRELYAQRLGYLDLIISKRKEDADLLREGAELERQTATAAEQKKMLTDIDNSAKSVFANVAENGVNSFKKIGQSLKTNLWDMLWELTAKKWIFNVGASITSGLSSSVAGAATGGSGASGIMSNIIGGANPLTDFTGSATNALYSLGGAATNAGLTSIGDTITANAGAMGNFAAAAGNALSYVSALSSLSKGNYGSALGSVAGTIFGGPLGSVIGGKIGGLVDGLFKKGNPTSSTGDSNIKFNQAGEETSRLDMSTVTAFKATASTAADDIVRGVQAQYAAAAKSLGISVMDSAFAYSGNTGKGGKESLFALRGGAGGAYYGGNGDVATTPESLKLETSRVILTALQGSELPKYLSGMLDGINAGALNQSQIDQVLNAATAYKAFHAQLSGLPFANLKDLSYTAASALTAAAGGLEAFNSKLGAYYNNYYNVEEKRAQIIKNINEQTAGSGFDAATATAAGFRKLVEAQDVTTESGRKTYTQLMSVSEAFFGLGENLRKLESDTATLKIELMRAQGNSAGADRAQYAIDTAGLSDAERAVFDYNASIRAQIAELNNAAEAPNNAAEASKKASEAIRSKAKADIDSATAALDNAKKSTDAALSALEKSYAAEKSRASVIRDAAAESVRVISGIFDLLKTQTTELYNSVSSTAAMQAAQGNAFIDNALNNAQKTGYLPDQKQLAEAISAARGGLSSTQYATQFEADQAALITAGKLSQLQEISGTQLTAAEKSLKIAEGQLAALDAALEYQREQVNALNSINSGVLSVADAVAGLSGAISAQKAAQSTVNAAQAQGAASLYASNPDVIKNPGKTGLDFWQKEIDTAGYDATASKFDAVVNWIIGDIKGWYSANPNATQSPDAADINYWMGEWDYMGQVAAKEKFDKTVAAMTGTALSSLPSYAVGANYIPHDQIAQLHEGEAVVPKAYNPAAGGIGGDTVRLEALVEALTSEVQRLQSIVADGNEHQRRTAVAVNGNPDMPIIVQQV